MIDRKVLFTMYYSFNMAGRVQGYWAFDHVREILARLPFKSLMRFKSLSKQWKLEISGDNFNRFRKQLSMVEHKVFRAKELGGDSPQLVVLRIDSTNFDSLEVNIHLIKKIKIPPKIVEATHQAYAVVNCRGVLCFFINLRDGNYSFVVWNPLTTEHKIFSRPYEIGWMSFGFGYDHSADDYKLIYASGLDGGGETKVECLSLKTGAGNTARIDLSYPFEIRGFAKNVNDYLYWLAKNYEEYYYGTFVILCLDLEKEVISEVTSLCVDKLLNGRRGCYLNVLEGSLCLIGHFNKTWPFDVWMMMEDQMMMMEDQMTATKYWIKFMTIPATFCWSPNLLCFIKNGVLYKVGAYDSEEFFLYNLLDGSINKIVAHGYDCSRYCLPFIPYN